MSASSRIITVQSADEGLRLDQFLVDFFPEYSRSQISAAIRGGRVLVEGEQKKSSYRLKAKEEILFSGIADKASPLSLIPEKIDFPVLHEDQYLLVLVKPPGLVVHPGNGNYQGTLVHGLLHYCREMAGVGGDLLRPGIVHRLDKDTSGVMVVAKKEDVHRQLVDMFASRRLEKEYLALVCGSPKEEEGEIVAPIGRHPVHRQKMAVVTRGGRYAASRWSVKQRWQGYTLLQVKIETGRTHQIRVHLASRGLPVAGDLLYGGSRTRQQGTLFPRQMLHAHRLSFLHPVTGQSLDLVADLWPDMQQAVEKLVEE